MPASPCLIVESYSYSELSSRADEYDEDVYETPSIDRFCSSSHWVLPSFEGLMPGRDELVLRSENGWVLLARGYDQRVGHYLEPFEAAWGLSSPLIGSEPELICRDFMRAMRRRQREWDLLLLSGIPRRSSLFDALRRSAAGYRLAVGTSTRNYIASLDGGLDGFMSRRSAKFRANLRRAARKAEARGVSFECSDHRGTDTPADSLYERILEIERRSWKGKKYDGDESVRPMYRFYRLMVRRLLAAGALRTIFATLDGRDVAYAFGGVGDGLYRGLQFSFDDDYRELSLGNVIQYRLIAWLAEHGVHSYDLGSDMDYKKRWAEQTLTLVPVYVTRD